MIRYCCLLLVLSNLSVLLSGCSASNEEPSADAVPEWAQEAVWYHIFVERFRNGDPSSDPRLHDI